MVVASAHSLWLGFRDLLWTDAVASAAVGLVLVPVAAWLALHGVWRRRSRRVR